MKQTIWFPIEMYNEDLNFGKPYLHTVPNKWKNEFATVTEMYDTIMNNIQFHVNLYFQEFFDHVEPIMLPTNKYDLIKFAVYNTFTSILYGVLITDKNVKTTFATEGFNVEQALTRDTGSYLDKFPPTALKALTQTGIKQLMDLYKDWEIVITHIGDLNYDSIYTKDEVDQQIELVRIETETLLTTIGNYVEERLEKFERDLVNSTTFLDNISAKTSGKIIKDIKNDEELQEILEGSSGVGITPEIEKDIKWINDNKEKIALKKEIPFWERQTSGKIDFEKYEYYITFDLEGIKVVNSNNPKIKNVFFENIYYPIYSSVGQVIFSKTEIGIGHGLFVLGADETIELGLGYLANTNDFENIFIIGFAKWADLPRTIKVYRKAK